LKPAIGGLRFEPPTAIGDALRKQFQAEECRMPADGRRDPNRIQFARIQRPASSAITRIRNFVSASLAAKQSE
jgi:hypothetical protein